MSTQLQDQINNSKLSTEDKEDFIFFLENISEEELNQMNELFSEDASELVLFWTTLKKKLIFMELLDKNTDFSDETKDNIKQQLSKMGTEEFDSFLEAVQKIADGADTKNEIDSLLEQNKKNNEELSALTEKLISE